MGIWDWLKGESEEQKQARIKQETQKAKLIREKWLKKNNKLFIQICDAVEKNDIDQVKQTLEKTISDKNIAIKDLMSDLKKYFGHNRIEWETEGYVEFSQYTSFGRIAAAIEKHKNLDNVETYDSEGQATPINKDIYWEKINQSIIDDISGISKKFDKGATAIELFNETLKAGNPKYMELAKHLHEEVFDAGSLIVSGEKRIASKDSYLGDTEPEPRRIYTTFYDIANAVVKSDNSFMVRDFKTTTQAIEKPWFSSIKTADEKAKIDWERENNKLFIKICDAAIENPNKIKEIFEDTINQGNPMTADLAKELNKYFENKWILWSENTGPLGEDLNRYTTFGKIAHAIEQGDLDKLAPYENTTTKHYDHFIPHNQSLYWNKVNQSIIDQIETTPKQTTKEKLALKLFEETLASNNPEYIILAKHLHEKVFGNKSVMLEKGIYTTFHDMANAVVKSDNGFAVKEPVTTNEPKEKKWLLVSQAAKKVQAALSLSKGAKVERTASAPKVDKSLKRTGSAPDKLGAGKLINMDSLAKEFAINPNEKLQQKLMSTLISFKDDQKKEAWRTLGVILKEGKKEHIQAYKDFAAKLHKFFKGYSVEVKGGHITFKEAGEAISSKSSQVALGKVKLRDKAYALPLKEKSAPVKGKNIVTDKENILAEAKESIAAKAEEIAPKLAKIKMEKIIENNVTEKLDRSSIFAVLDNTDNNNVNRHLGKNKETPLHMVIQALSSGFVSKELSQVSHYDEHGRIKTDSANKTKEIQAQVKLFKQSTTGLKLDIPKKLAQSLDKLPENYEHTSSELSNFIKSANPVIIDREEKLAQLNSVGAHIQSLCLEYQAIKLRSESKKELETLDRAYQKELHEQMQPKIEELLKMGANVNAQSSSGLTPLMMAAKLKNPALIQKLINCNADIEIVDNMKYNAAHYAALSGDAESLTIMLGKSPKLANLLKKTIYGDSVLELAIVNIKDQKLTELLPADLSSISKEQRPITKYDILSEAIEARKTETALAIIRNKTFDFRQISAGGSTPFLCATRAGNEEIIQAMINEAEKRGYKDFVNQKDHAGNNALIIAAEYEKGVVIDILAKAGIKMNEQNKLGNTALMVAIDRGNLDSAEKLVENKANINQRNAWFSGKTALDIAFQKSDAAAINFLVENKAKLRAPTDKEAAEFDIFTKSRLNREKVFAKHEPGIMMRVINHLFKRETVHSKIAAVRENHERLVEDILSDVRTAIEIAHIPAKELSEKSQSLKLTDNEMLGLTRLAKFVSKTLDRISEEKTGKNSSLEYDLKLLNTMAQANEIKELRNLVMKNPKMDLENYVKSGKVTDKKAKDSATKATPKKSQGAKTALAKMKDRYGDKSIPRAIPRSPMGATGLSL